MLGPAIKRAERIWSRNGAADCLEVRQRKVLLVALSSMTIILLLKAPPLIAYGAQIARTTVALGTVMCILTICWICCGRKLSEVGLVVFMYIGGACIAAGDLSDRTIGQEAWPMLVLILDMLLVLRVRERYTMWFVGMVVVWFFVLSLEAGYRFGLMDLPGLESNAKRKEEYEKTWQCESPPCARGFSYASEHLMTQVAVFVIDFVATRGFARQVLAEQAAMERTIATVEGVTRLLAKYDVDAVDRMLTQREADLPALMFETLKQMEENLRQYRPYLPAALFEEVENAGSEERQDEQHGATGESGAIEPPGVATGKATIVFTDIRLSTSIWECAPEGMRAGLRIHNAVIRDVMQAFNGYEVKTIGDAFMVAFETTLDGMSFALRVHERLRDAAWPASLLEDAPICAEQGSLWGGLTVRIGVNSGGVDTEQNTVTGRTDYFGHTVNVAARLESTCTPGAVAVLCELWCTECSTLSAAVGEAEALYLKGLSGSAFVQSVWPVSLAGRKYNAIVQHAPGTPDNASVLSTSAAHSARTRVSLFRGNSSATELTATVAVMVVPVGGVGNSLDRMSFALTAMLVALDQSGGMLVTLLGNCVCVGWNLSRALPAHMENAIRFAQRMLSTGIGGAGLVTGTVHYGSVGARTQRFVTVMGDTVRRAWRLCEEAVTEGGLCLYEPPEGKTLPSALDELLTPITEREGVHKVLPEADRLHKDETSEGVHSLSWGSATYHSKATT